MAAITALTRVILLLSAITVLCIIVGFSTVAWIRMQAQFQPITGDVFTGNGELRIPARTMRYELGLWAVRVCSDGTCVLMEDSSDVSQHARDNKMSDLRDLLPIRPYRILASVAIATCLLAVFFLFMHVRRPSDTDKCYAILLFISLTTTGILMWVVVGRFTKIILNLHPLVRMPAEVHTMMPYSLVLSAIGASAGLIVSGLVVMEMVGVHRQMGKGGYILSNQPLVHVSSLQQKRSYPKKNVSMTSLPVDNKHTGF